MGISTYSTPLTRASADDRNAYLQRVGTWTAGGLTLAAISGIGMAVLVAATPALQGQFASLGIILGAYFGAQFLGTRMVFGGQKVLGFVLGNVLQGIAMGYLLLVAVAVGTGAGAPFSLIGQALLATAATSLGMVAYTWTKPRDFSYLGAFLSMTFVPMLVLMAVGFVFPALFGGTFGLIISLVFVAISAAGLLYQLNAVLHELDTGMHIEGAYMISMGVLILFWNILSLLLRLQGRD